MKTGRRDFLKGSALTLALLGLRRHTESFPGTVSAAGTRAGYGPLIQDSSATLDLPLGFKYKIISETGQRMSDGFFVPGAHDGMAAFSGPAGRTILVRNHELTTDRTGLSAFGGKNALVSRVAADRIYDAAPALGGTTTLIYDTRNSRLEKHYLSLAGTVRNCAGGPTPWNSWISCEESVQPADEQHRKDHGYAFEVPAAAEGLVEAVPLKAMGRFVREAIAVDPETGIVYQTEDRPDGLLYRFIPIEPGKLRAGGRLQALKISGMEGADTSNLKTAAFPARKPVDVEWIDLEDVESPGENLRYQGHAKGATRFVRSEGICAAGGAIYFVATGGGPAGQIWRHTPETGKLELFLQSTDRETLDMPDNIVMSPLGDLIMCEDGPKPNCLVGVTPEGELYKVARNTMNDSEFAGATFSPDGSTLFVNLQRPGLTFAISGPWKKKERI